MKLIDQLIQALQSGDAKQVSALFCEEGILHDASQLRLGQPALHLEGRMGIEMSYHNRFGFNGGPYQMTGLVRSSDECYFALITYPAGTVEVCLHLVATQEGKIKRLNLYSL